MSVVSFAQTITLSATDSADVASPPASIQYDFPYPGILPDHPLYFVKVARDHIVGFLINDPIKKTEFNLLQSDKRIFAAQLLFEKDADQLGVDTLSKSNNYMHSAISDAKRAQEAKLPTEGVVGKIEVSIAKHEEAIEQLLTSDITVTDSLEGELERLQSIEEYYKKSFPKK
ncbi:MAG TPA: DUF5667 domain-containing protein [Candidatus Levybacteria bacterium]|nr:DUF5667 domain-containing protein [Candidatus Levybacteria bacterium]